MFCYQRNYQSPTEPVSKALFDSLVDSEQTRWLTATHRELRAALPAIAEGDKALLERWESFEPFVKYSQKQAASRARKTKGQTIGEWWATLSEEQKLQHYCQYLKESLPFVIFIATYDETEAEKSKKRGAWRKQAACRLNGLCVIDFDHIEGDMRQVWDKAVGNLSQQDYERIVLAFVTPSNQGLKAVFTADPKIGNLADNQIDLALKLGLNPDQSGKDASRGTFLTPREDILLIDEKRLFTYHDAAFAKKYEALYHEGKSQPTKEWKNAELRMRNAECGAKPSDASRHSEFSIPNSEFLTYHGVPYAKIVDAWLDGKTIEPGDRHRTSLNLADHLRYITDNDAGLIETILRQTPFVDEIVRERDEDVAGTVASAQKYQMYKNIPQRMREALVKCGIMNAECGIVNAEMQSIRQSHYEEKPGDASRYSEFRIPNSELKTDIYAALPLDQWAVELTELAKHYPCMKALFANVHPRKYPAVLFSAAAMLGTLMTRTWYHFWYEPSIMRRLNYSIIIIGNPGCGKNNIEQLYKKICDPMIQADQVSIDAVNRYKDGRTERETSTKAQKGEALKKPVVGIRVHPARTAIGEFIRHMMAAKEQVQGHELNLHMFSFDAELDNVTSQNKGGDYKNRESMELKAFHNEEDGQMYANKESITATFNVYWNFIYTGTPYALHRKVNQKNFGTGLSTRLAVIPMPDADMAQRHQEKMTEYMEELKTWAYRLDRVEGELPIEPLNDETYEWQSDHMEIAKFNNDDADKTLLKRIPYYGIGISLPFIVMRHWDEWQESKTLSIDDMDKRLCRIAMDIQYRCQHFFFGEMAHNYFEDQTKEFVPRRRTTKYAACFRKLPDEFKTEKFMECFDCTQSAASRAITRFQKDGVIEKLKYGLYKKRLNELP